MYLGSMIFFFFLGGFIALAIRSQLFRAGSTLLAPQSYNVAFTIHGVIMIFLFIVPGVPATLGNFLLPLMIGAKDVAFPRMNRLSYWIYALGALFAFGALFMGVDTGWTFYAPYSIQNRWGVVTMTLAAFVLGFSSILTGLNFLVTIHKLRCPGMSWNRLPLFVWTLYATAILQVVATPVIGITLLLLILENLFGVGVFNPAMGGDPVLFQHFFWFYSHPVVYIMILPSMGIISEIVPVFSRKPIFGYKALVAASIGIAVISVLVWGHHMFVAGMSDAARIAFSLLTFLVAVPTAVKVFNWLSTMYKGSISFESPMLYAMAFIFLFMIAGTSGIHLATLATDAHYHDTYFVVAHFHYTIQGGAVIGLYAGLHFWFPLIFGRVYNEKLARLAFWMVFIGFNGTFLPQFALGMEGMPRRYFTYPAEFEPLHQVSTVFAFLNGTGYSLVLLNLLYAAFRGKRSPANPWGSLGLEWSTSLPPPHDNFERIPVVEDWSYGYAQPQTAVRLKQMEEASRAAQLHQGPQTPHEGPPRHMQPEQAYDAAKLGMWIFLGTEILLFGGLFCAYIIYRLANLELFATASRHLSWPLGTLNTVILLTSSYFMARAVSRARSGDNDGIIRCLDLTLLCALAFLVIKGFEYAAKFEHHLFPPPNIYFGLYFATTGLHALHVLCGMGVIVWLRGLAENERFSKTYFTPVEMGGLYWHLVDVIWIYLFPLLYLI